MTGATFCIAWTIFVWTSDIPSFCIHVLFQLHSSVLMSRDTVQKHGTSDSECRYTAVTDMSTVWFSMYMYTETGPCPKHQIQNRTTVSFHIWNLTWFRAVRVQNQNERFSKRKDLNWANFTKKDWFKSYATLCAPQCSIVGHLEIMYVRVGHACITLRSCASRISLSWELHARTAWGWN